MNKPNILYSGPVVKRAQARELGLKRYFTGEPCKHGHIEERSVNSYVCYECARVSTLKFSRENPDKVKASSDAWNSLNREANKKRYKDYRDRNKEEISESWKDWYSRNKESVSLRNKKWKENNGSYFAEYRKNNKEKIKSTSKAWGEKNKDKKSASRHAYRSRKSSADGVFSHLDVENILAKQNNRCAEPTCSIDITDNYHIDHIMPLYLGGSNWPDNLQCLCPACNLSKGAKHPIDWARRNGRLL